MPVTQNQIPDAAVVAVFDTHPAAEGAVRELQKAGFPMDRLSVVGKDFQTDEHVMGYYNLGDRVKSWGSVGALWGGAAGFLFGSAFLVIPGIGPLVVLGPLASWIIGALEGAVVGGGLTAFGAALYSIGVPKDSIVRYETAVRGGKFLVVAHGTADEVARARAVLATARAASVDEHERDIATV